MAEDDKCKCHLSGVRCPIHDYPFNQSFTPAAGGEGDKTPEEAIMGDYETTIAHLTSRVADLEKAIAGIKPPEQCPFCEPDKPCGSCYQLAAMEGSFATLLRKDGVGG